MEIREIDSTFASKGRGKISKLKQFLNKNNIVPSADLPAVHTTRACNLEEFTLKSSLVPRPCNAFVGENLNYFFYGKPSYKLAVSAQQSKEWEMPICFLIRIHKLPSIKRIYPFDSGAFLSKRHPEYIGRKNIDEFEAEPVPDTPQKIVGAFFYSIRDFFHLKPKSEDGFKIEFSLNIRDSSILALRDLAGDSSLPTIDDRRFAIEIQTEEEVFLNSDTVEAVVIPESYFNDDVVQNYITNELRATPLLYSTYTLSSSDHTALVYDCVAKYLKAKGLL